MIANIPRPGQVPLLKELWQEAFGDDRALIDDFFATAYSPSRCRCIVRDRQVLAAAYWLDCQGPQGKLAYVYAVATAAQARGQGLCHALLGQIHGQLLEQGYAGTVLVPGNEALGGLYEGMGYQYFGGIREFSAEMGSQAAALREIGPMEYARLRRQYLPQGGVRQTGENLRFLRRYAKFAAGEDFLLAYSRGPEGFMGLELLGNAQGAPGILAALGEARGRFRCPGQKPFAMYRPADGAPAPAYFGLALD